MHANRWCCSTLIGHDRGLLEWLEGLREARFVPQRALDGLIRTTTIADALAACDPGSGDGP